jgi:hypothetical protein
MANLGNTTIANGNLTVNGNLVGDTKPIFPPGTVLQVDQDDNNNVTFTTSQSGFEALRCTLTPTTANSKFLVIGNVYGAANDDAHAWIEYRIGGGAWVRNTVFNGEFAGGAAFADFSYAIEDTGDTNDAQTGYGTCVLWSPNTSQTVDVRVICSDEGGGFALNIGRSRDTATSYNNTTTKSSLIMMEIAG